MIDETPSEQRQSVRPNKRRKTWPLWLRITGTVVGTALTLLGLLWALQGADLVRIEPIGCVANCEPITEGSIGWLVTGVLAALVGLWLVYVAIRRRR
ncbi:hypothetical protein ACFOLD_09695 [Kocuria carniphila]|uniref:hypothetical protein n=1 Tax=Kocuria carniphila TaxID=262208 RepID=UPI0036218A5D